MHTCGSEAFSAAERQWVDRVVSFVSWLIFDLNIKQILSGFRRFFYQMSKSEASVETQPTADLRLCSGPVQRGGGPWNRRHRDI